jgi:hypothetical protein
VDATYPGRLYPGTKFYVESKVFDPEGWPLDVTFIINNVEYKQPRVELSFPQPGEYPVVLRVSDNLSTVEKMGTITILSYPQVLVKIISLSFQGDIGDGIGNPGDPYLLVDGVNVPILGLSPSLQSNIYPRGAPDTVKPQRVFPGTTIDYGTHSGIIVFQGELSGFLGILITVIDHDERGFSWGGFFKSLLRAAGAIVGAFVPVWGAVVSGIGQLADAVITAVVKEPQDYIIASFTQVHTPTDRWDIGTIHSLTSPNGVTVRYIIELM